MTTGALMLDIEGLALTDDDKVLLQEPDVGGLIIFARNIESYEQLSELVASIRQIRPDLLIAIDQEGGRVQRLKDGVSVLPPMAVLGQLADSSVEQAIDSARELGWLMAAELLQLQIDISFAPVLDLDFGRSGVIGDRAFASSAERVTALAGAFMKGMAEAGMAATGKHFPGHGWVEADSHLAVPVDERSVEQIEADDLKPFAALVDQGLQGIMPAHVIYPKVCEQPAGFSEHWLQSVLRQQLGFDGVIFSDDLTMEGASVAGGYPQRAAAAIEAGCDMLLVCNDRVAALEVLKWLKSQSNVETGRLAKMMRRAVEIDGQRLDKAKALAEDLVKHASVG